MPQKRRDTLPKTHRRVVGQTPVAGQPRRISRREKEERQRRQLFWGVGIAAVAVLLILSAATLNEYWFKPRHVLASVNGHEIRRRDYWKYRAVDLANQASQYASIANSGFVSSDQASQYSQLAQQASAQIDGVWGSTDVDDQTLQKMIDDQVYVQSLDKFGITITDQDVNDYIAQQYGPPDAPIFTPTPSPTLIPQRAEWATQTAAAAIATQEPSVAAASPEAASPIAASPVTEASPAGQPEAVAPAVSASPAAVISPKGSTAGAQSSPFAGGEATPMASPAGSPAATPEVSPTPNEAQARETATANFKDYQDAVFGRAHVSRADYVRLIVRPAIARERIDAQLTAPIGQTAEQVRAAHILVDTKDLADAIYQQVTTGGANFEEVAKEQSIDSATAPNGGDLGWFTRGQMVDQFDQVAFSTPPGQISQPVQTKFGWHIIKVYDHQQDRAMTDEQISAAKQAAIDNWLKSRKAELKIESEVEPTPTSSAPENFVPPAGAPPTPTPTEVPSTVEPAASPEAIASPVASPVAGA